MKTLKTFLTAVLVVLTAAVAFGSSNEHERKTGDIERQPAGYQGKIYGTIEKLPEKGLSGIWVVNGKGITVTKDTMLEEEHGKAEVGAYVEVKGAQSGNVFAADKIEVKRAKESAPSGAIGNKFYGTVEKIPKGLLGTWVVSGKEIHVLKDTVLKEKHGKADIGATIEVEGTVSGETFTAYKIEVKQTGK